MIQAPKKGSLESCKICVREKCDMVVMVWEHKHIANKKLEDAFPGKAVTLRQQVHFSVC